MKIPVNNYVIYYIVWEPYNGADKINGKNTIMRSGKIGFWETYRSQYTRTVT